MHKSSTQKSGIPVSRVLKQRNNSMTPSASNRLSAGPSKMKYGESNKRTRSASKERLSEDKISRISLASVKITPSKFNTPKQNKPTLVMPQYSKCSTTETVRSSVGGRSGISNWPLSEPSFKTQCIDKVLEFLVNNGIDYPVNRNVLRSPKKADFIAMFNFIYSQLSSGFSLSNRIEEEVPKLMKNLKYPFQLQKSLFLNVGSPHSWPSVLAMLAFLVDLVYMNAEFDASEIYNGNDFEEPQLTNKKLFCLVANFRGNDEDEMLMEYKTHVEKVQKLSEEDFNAIKKKGEKLSIHLQNMCSSSEKVKLSEEQLERIREDKVKLFNFNKEMERHITAKNSERAHEEANLENLKEHSHELENEIKRLKEKKIYQNYSVAEIGRLKKHKEEVAVQLAQLDNEKKHLNEQLWPTEMELSKLRKKNNESVFKYNTMCEDLQMEDCKISLVNTNDDLIAWGGKITPLLKEHRKKLRDQNFQIRNTVMNLESEKGKVLQMVQATENDLHKLNCKLKRLESEASCLKKEIAEEGKILCLELEKVGEAVAQERELSNWSPYEKQRQMEDIKKKHEMEVKRVEEAKNKTLKLYLEEHNKIREFINKKNSLVKMHEERTKETIAKHVQDCNAILNIE